MLEADDDGDEGGVGYVSKERRDKPGEEKDQDERIREEGEEFAEVRPSMGPRGIIRAVLREAWLGLDARETLRAAAQTLDGRLTGRGCGSDVRDIPVELEDRHAFRVPEQL